MTGQYLTQLLQGENKPTIGRLEALATALGVEVSDLTADELGTLARHFEKNSTCKVSRKYLTYPSGREVETVERHLENVAAERRLRQNPNLSLRFRSSHVAPRDFASLAAIVERVLGELTGNAPDDAAGGLATGQPACTRLARSPSRVK